MRRYKITDQEWALIAHLLPGKTRDVSRSETDNRLFVNAVLWIDRSGTPWCLEFGLPSLSRLGQDRLENLFEHLQEPD